MDEDDRPYCGLKSNSDSPSPNRVNIPSVVDGDWIPQNPIELVGQTRYDLILADKRKYVPCRDDD